MSADEKEAHLAELAKLPEVEELIARRYRQLRGEITELDKSIPARQEEAFLRGRRSLATELAAYLGPTALATLKSATVGLEIYQAIQGALNGKPITCQVAPQDLTVKCGNLEITGKAPSSDMPLIYSDILVRMDGKYLSLNSLHLSIQPKNCVTLSLEMPLLQP